MRPPVREYGLQITKYVDERCDPVMSTKAAITYLQNLYRQFDSWELAMAAYNAGPGRVRYAIRKSGSKDYWELQAYLPKETRSYVPGFIAASYVLNYYQDHGLQPAFPGSDLMLTATIPVFKNLDFSLIQQVTGVAYEVICNLNPKYIRKFIPQTEGGHILVLPASAAATMAAFLNSDGDVAAMANTGFAGIETGVEMEYVDRLIEHAYYVKSGDNLYNLAKKHDCTVSELQKWNKLPGTMLRIGQRLKIMKMEKVLVKVAQPAPVLIAVPARKTLEIARLSTPGTEPAAIDQMVSARERAMPTPVFRPAPDLSGSATILRRRTSARDLGVLQPARSNGLLLPGKRLN
jgi:membrane-bound lytic murein transglycosylase D